MITGKFQPKEGLAARVHAAGRAASAELSQSVLADCAPYVPFDTGTLAGSGRALNESVEYTADYAKKVYYADAMSFNKKKRPDASARWLVPVKAIKLECWRRAAADTVALAKEDGI